MRCGIMIGAPGNQAFIAETAHYHRIFRGNVGIVAQLPQSVGAGGKNCTGVTGKNDEVATHGGYHHLLHPVIIIVDDLELMSDLTGHGVVIVNRRTAGDRSAGEIVIAQLTDSVVTKSQKLNRIKTAAIALDRLVLHLCQRCGVACAQLTHTGSQVLADSIFHYHRHGKRLLGVAIQTDAQLFLGVVTPAIETWGHVKVLAIGVGSFHGYVQGDSNRVVRTHGNGHALVEVIVVFVVRVHPGVAGKTAIAPGITLAGLHLHGRITATVRVVAQLAIAVVAEGKECTVGEKHSAGLAARTDADSLLHMVGLTG